jgi:hypothetical protein
MSRWIVVAWALWAPAFLGAQRASSPDAREQQRIVDSTVARWQRAGRALSAFDDSVARTRALTDTLRVGALRLLVEPGLRDRAQAAAQIASARLDSVAGPEARRLEADLIVVRFLKDSVRDTVVVAARARNDKEFLTVWGPANDSTLVSWIHTRALRLLTMSMDRRMTNWLGNSEVTPDSLATGTWLGTRLDLVSSPATVARRCYDGDIAACKVALRLVDTGDPIMTWFDADGRRRYVESAAAFYNSPKQDADACIAGSDAACIGHMRSKLHYSDPVPPFRRATVAAIAIEIGGRSGYQRLLGATGSPTDRLEAAAGVPIDSVLRVWVAKVRDARRPGQAMSTGIAMSSLGWILVCGVLALRSSRWR